MHTLYLKKGREDNLARRHPWLFSGAIQRCEGDPQAGETVCVCASDRSPLAVAAYSPASQIRARIWDFAPDTKIDAAFFHARLQQSIAARAILQKDGNAVRLVFSESDQLPGLIVDQYAGYLVCQFLSAGAEFHKSTIVSALRELTACDSIYERSDAAVRSKEGLASSVGVLNGVQPPDLIEIDEYGQRILVDICRGHKTGFYLDQRENRLHVRTASTGQRVLNCFAYTGGFGLAALAGGAKHVVNVDSSAPSLALAVRNFESNDFAAAQYENIQADAFDCLRQFQREGRQFDLIVLDPPKFVESKSQLQRGARAYKDINMQAFKLLTPDGLLFTFSCSGLLPTLLFQKIIADAALDAGCHAHIVRRLGQAADHPVSLNFPEADYLKGFCIRKSP
jgi:23S rRNA (cytosine1962-C5)-methyltransferase